MNGWKNGFSTLIQMQFIWHNHCTQDIMIMNEHEYKCTWMKMNVNKLNECKLIKWM